MIIALHAEEDIHFMEDIFINQSVVRVYNVLKTVQHALMLDLINVLHVQQAM